MTNEQLIRSVQVWALGVTLAAGIFAFSGNVESAIWNSEQQNANSNTSGSQNSNTRKTQNQNSENRNATGEPAGMAAMSSQDQKFLTEAAMGGMMEVEMGRWAAQIGTSDAVKQFGRRMVEDHSRANEELKQLATAKGVTLPTTLDEKHQREVSKLARMKGADFDKAYSKKMLSDHQKDVAAFEKQSTSGSDAEVKAFATKVLPTLQEHLTQAKALTGTDTGGMKNDNSNSNSNRNSNSNSNNSNRP